MSTHSSVSAISTASQSPINPQSQLRVLPLADVVSEIHEQSVPDFASRALDRLQGSLYASLKYLQLCEPGQVLPHTWVGYRNGEITGVLLFRVQGRCVKVVSEVIVLDPSQIDAFSACVFRHFPGVRRIIFNAVSLQSRPCSLPNQHFAYSENYVLTLPASNETYLAALGKSTRQSVRGYRNRLRRDFPDFSWTAYTCDVLSTEQQRDLVQTLQRFKRESMNARGKSASIDPAETERILTMAAECGLFGIGVIQGRVCAGALSCRIGDTYVMLLSASDPTMSSYRLGMLTCLWSIGDCIERGARECHLLWGRYAYKHQLKAVPRVLQRMMVYPSVRQMLLQPLTVLMMMMRGRYVRGERWLREQIAAQNIPALKWLVRQFRMIKPTLVFFRGILQRLRSRSASMMASKNMMCTAGGDVVGTGEKSRCPTQFPKPSSAGACCARRIE